ncbi:MAG: hypothetical protein UH080_07825 [Ruminococcus sp.]|nr:hypothetical protein [Ruminococcus sp.]
MKKIKYLLVAVMAVMLCLICLMTTTFSWFTRASDSGGIFEWRNSESGLSYKVSDGEDITMVTYELSEDGKSSATESVIGFTNTSGIESGHRKYYRTDITNSGDAEQSVSLYMSGLEITDGEFYLGVNSPLKTYKGINASKESFTMANNDEMRVYLNRNGCLTGSTFIVAYKGKDSDQYTREYLWYDGSGDNYHQDIPIGAKRMFFAEENNTGNNRSNDIDVDYEYSKLPSIYPKLFTLKTGSGYCGYTVSDFEDGANLLQYYDTISMTNGETFNLNLEKGVHYTGKSIDYSVASGNCITVSNNVITAVSEGTATISTKVYGPYGDYVSKETTVVVSGSSSTTDTPIVTNYAVPASKDGKATTVSVYWYINNEGSDKLTYTIDDVYLSL